MQEKSLTNYIESFYFVLNYLEILQYTSSNCQHTVINLDFYTLYLYVVEKNSFCPTARPSVFNRKLVCTSSSKLLLEIWRNFTGSSLVVRIVRIFGMNDLSQSYCPCFFFAVNCTIHNASPDFISKTSVIARNFTGLW